MKKVCFLIVVMIIVGLLTAAPRASAHVPYLEHFDYSAERPFFIRDIEQSIAVYSWLEFDESGSTDVDVYLFYLSGPTRVFIESLVPVCTVYENFLPSFAVVGPGLPAHEGDLPFKIPDGYGAVVVTNYAPGEERPSFYEPFGGKSYYDGPDFDQVLNTSGLYYVYFWDPAWEGGDYVGVFGKREIWRIRDIVRGLTNTPKIRRNEELHKPCEGPSLY